MITLCKFPPNMAWAFVFHHPDRLITEGSPLRLHGEPMFYETRKAAVRVAEGLGFRVDPRSGHCHVIMQEGE